MNSTLGKALQGALMGLGCSMLAALLYLGGALEAIELWALDYRFRVLPAATPAELPRDVVIVAIDQNSIESVYRQNGYRWPWPRAFYAKMLEFLTAADTRAVGFDIFFTEPDMEREDITGAESDAQLLAATGEGARIFHSLLLKKEGFEPPRDEVTALTNKLQDLSITIKAAEPERFASAALPAAELSAASRMVGFVNVFPERDNVFRRVPLIAAMNGVPVPSLALSMAWDLNGRPPIIADASTLTLGSQSVPVDAKLRPYLWWYKSDQADGPFIYVPAARLLHAAVQHESGLEPELSVDLFRDKIVLFGSTAPGLFDIRATPLSKLTPGVEIQATLLVNLLRNDFVRRTTPVSVVLLLVVLCTTTGAVTRGIRHALPGAIMLLVLLVALISSAVALLAVGHIFMDLVPLTGGLLLTFLLVTFVNYMTERKQALLIRHIFEHYLDRSVVKSLINNPDRVRLGGERRECTVLFSDVANFTSTSEQMKPEAVVHFMNVYLNAMTEIIIEEGGFVDKFVGDEIVAIFGAPNDLPNHAAVACRAISRMQERLLELAPRFREMHCPGQVFARSGISSGELVVGNMGSEERMNYTAMGDVMNLGARLESANKQYATRILCAEATVKQSGAEFLFREIDRVRVKGKAQPVRIFELLAGAEREGVKARARAEFSNALHLYRQGQWREARQLFQSLAEQGDPTAESFAIRCAQFCVDPPSDWNGISTLFSK